MNLKITKEEYGVCGKCMFLSPSYFQIQKHSVKDAYCLLFNQELNIDPDKTINSWTYCDDVYQEGVGNENR